MRTRQARWPCPYDGHPLAGIGSTCERMHALGHQAVGGKALQPANLYRFTFGHFAHANLFAQRFGRADPRAHSAHNVLRKDGLGCRIGRASCDLANEQGDVDGCGTSRHTGRIVAEVAPIRRNTGFMCCVSRLIVGKVLGHLAAWQALRHDTGRLGGIGHGASTSCHTILAGRLAQVRFFIKW